MRRAKSDYVIQTVANAFRLLEAFENEDSLGVTELAQRLQIHKNNTFRLLATLQHLGYMEMTEDDRYRLAAGCLRLGRMYSARLALPQVARPIMERLCEDTGETTHLAILDGFDVVHIGGVESGQLVSSKLRTGSCLAAHCTALGKSLLAACSDEQLTHIDLEYLQRGALRERTSATITDPGKFLDHLRTVAAQGFAIDYEECGVGLCCVAAVVQGADNTPRAALSLSAPANRFSEAVLYESTGPLVMAAAAEISRNLGGPCA